METKFDPNKPVRTKSGAQARIVDKHFNFNSNQEGLLVAIIRSINNKSEFIHYYDKEGKCIEYNGESYDLVNIPETHTVWINFYENNDRTVYGNIHHSSKAAKDARSNMCLSTMKVEFEEGRFDD